MNRPPQQIISIDDNSPINLENQTSKFSTFLQPSNERPALINIEVIQKYRENIDTIIENLIVGDQFAEEVPSLLEELNKFEKDKISWESALSLEYVQKLTFIQQELYGGEIKVNWKILEQEIKHWKEEIMRGLFDCTGQIQKFEKEKNMND